jgi:hypothetical protein
MNRQFRFRVWDIKNSYMIYGNSIEFFEPFHNTTPLLKHKSEYLNEESVERLSIEFLKKFPRAFGLCEGISL